jgi:hypothetical protein
MGMADCVRAPSIRCIALIGFMLLQEAVARIGTLAIRPNHSHHSRGVSMRNDMAIRVMKTTIAVQHGFLAAGVVVTIAAALQSIAIVFSWFG